MMADTKMDVVFVDAVTLKRIKACEHARRNAKTEWAEEYWTGVVKKLLASCSESDSDRVLH